MNVVAEQPWDWTLRQFDDGRLVLTVVCGTSAIYTKDHVLTSAEIEQYRQRGNAYLTALARKLA